MISGPGHSNPREWWWVGRGGGGFRAEVPGYQGARTVHFEIITKYLCND